MLCSNYATMKSTNQATYIFPCVAGHRTCGNHSRLAHINGDLLPGHSPAKTKTKKTKKHSQHNGTSKKRYQHTVQLTTTTTPPQQQRRHGRWGEGGQEEQGRTLSGITRRLKVPVRGCSPRPRNKLGGSTMQFASFSMWPSTKAYMWLRRVHNRCQGYFDRPCRHTAQHHAACWTQKQQKTKNKTVSPGYNTDRATRRTKLSPWHSQASVLFSLPLIVRL